MKRYRALTAVTASAGLILAMAACSPPEKGDKSGETSSGVKVSEATSAEDFGGMDALVAAAKKEGELNVIALPPDWANYGNIIKAFTDKYGIKINSAQPDGSSQDEINAANQQKGRTARPTSSTSASPSRSPTPSMFAPYKVATWDDIRDDFKDADGTWVNDYGGYMSIGYDAQKVPDVTKASTTCSARRSRARSRSTATRPRPAPRFAA